MHVAFTCIGRTTVGEYFTQWSLDQSLSTFKKRGKQPRDKE